MTGPAASNLQPRTCSHPIYVQMLTGVCQVISMFSSCFFQVFLFIGTLVSNMDVPAY